MVVGRRANGLTGTVAGDVVSNRRLDLSDSRDIANPTLRLGPGAYTLTVDGTGDATGYFNFRLTDLANAAPLAMELLCVW